LQPVSRSWLPASPPDSIRFVNSNGYRATLRRNRAVETAADSTSQQGRFGSDSYSLFENGSVNECGSYYRTERRRLSYEGTTLPISLSYALLRDFSGAYPNSTAALPLQEPIPRAVADTLPDVVLVLFNGATTSRFPVVRRPYRQLFQGVRFLDSARVAGRTFFGVYQHTLPPYGYGSSTAVRLRTLYFVPGQGVVAFVYTNNEQWARY
jgi:hypothetical protein